MRGLDHVDLARQEDVYWTLRTTLVARREDLEPFDRAFDAWFLRRAGRGPVRRQTDPRSMHKDAKRVRRDPRADREAAWKRLEFDLDRTKLLEMISEIGLAEVPEAARLIVEGRVRGRIVVKIG
jgi:uncharacterized protein with von Willebrand factor type A (vWA) domain